MAVSPVSSMASPKHPISSVPTDPLVHSLVAYPLRTTPMADSKPRRKKIPVPPLPFEKTIFAMESQLEELEAQTDPTPATRDAIRNMRVEITRMKREVFDNLDAFETVKVARHGERPQVLDYIELVFEAS